MGNVVDLFLKIVVGFVSVDEIFEWSGVEDHGEAVGDGENASEYHEYDILSFCKSKKISVSTGFHFFFLFFDQALVFGGFLSIGKLCLFFNKLLHAFV